MGGRCVELSSGSGWEETGIGGGGGPLFWGGGGGFWGGAGGGKGGAVRGVEGGGSFA